MRRPVIHRRQRELLEVVDALNPPGRRAGRLDGRSNSAIKTAMIAMTTSNSIRVKPWGRRDRRFIGTILLLRLNSFVFFDNLDLLGILDPDASLIVLADHLPRHAELLPLVVLGRIVDPGLFEQVGVVVGDDDGEVLLVAEVFFRIQVILAARGGVLADRTVISTVQRSST